MVGLKRLAVAGLVGGAFLAGAGVAWAGLGQPSDWQIGFQQSASPVMDTITSFHEFLLYVITAIVIFVLVLLVIVAMKFNIRANPTPSRTTHNTGLEIAWTLLPVLILVTIAVPSFRLLFYQLDVPAADLTIKATGKQWYWTYSYPDNGRFYFDSALVRDETKLRPDQPRLLGVDNEMVVPVNKVVRILTTGDDVIHSFAVPSFGIKIDAIPGRVNETWFRATREGLYYGQCSELCGKDHAYMPIAVRVLSEEAFNTWLDAAKKNPQWQAERQDGTRTLAAGAAE